MSAKDTLKHRKPSEAERAMLIHHDTIANLALGLEALGTLLFQHDDFDGLSDDTKRGIGYLTHEMGRQINRSLNGIAQIEDCLGLFSGGDE